MMTIEQREVTVGEVFDGYTNSEEQGVRGYGGKLDIRPPYQREFIYNEREQQAVVRTVLRGYPMGVMYWVRRSDDAECPYEVMDGQQRILRYPLTVYVCRGEPSEKLEWFRTINIAGKPLNEQEIRNAVYAGPFVSDAKRHFSKAACAAYRLGKDLVPGVPIRQDLLRRALEWMADHETRLGRPGTAVGYMARHQHDPNANPLWSYFQAVLNWALTNFDIRRFRPVMKGLDWALLYDTYGTAALDTEDLARRIAALMKDGEVQRRQGIIPYVLTGDERSLDLRAFPEDIRLAAWERQQGVCPLCGERFDYDLMEADHIVPWAKGGRTVPDNCQMLCRECNRRKSAK